VLVAAYLVVVVLFYAAGARDGDAETAPHASGAPAAATA
jgi:hypothetical protein